MPAGWQRYSLPIRAVYLFNQSLAGRLTIGPLLSSIAFVKGEAQRLAAGDRSNLSAWGRHALAVGLLCFWIGGIAGMPLWQYVCFVVYPGLGLGMLRSFGEHRYAERPQHRTAIVESGFPFDLLFLNNNLHLIHHLPPALPRYRIAVGSIRARSLRTRACRTASVLGSTRCSVSCPPVRRPSKF